MLARSFGAGTIKKPTFGFAKNGAPDKSHRAAAQSGGDFGDLRVLRPRFEAGKYS
jgi:hypothetical protein